MKNQLLALFLTLTMLCSLMPAAFAEEGTGTTCAKIGDETYSKVQDAVNDAKDGDTIVVTAFSGSDYETLSVSGKAVYIKADDEASDFGFSIDGDTECITWFHPQNSSNYLSAYIIGDLEKSVALASDSTFKSNLTSSYMPWFYVYTDIKLDSDIVLPSYNGTTTEISVETNAEPGLAIDLNGHTISQTAGSGWNGWPAISVSQGTLTIKDSVGNGAVVGAAIGVDIYDWTVGYPNDGYTAGKLILESGTIATEGISYNTNSYGGFGSVIRMYDGGTFEMKGGSLSLSEVKNSADLMGTIYLRGANQNNQGFNIIIEGGTVDVVPSSGIAEVSSLTSNGLVGYNNTTVAATSNGVLDVTIAGGVFGVYGETAETTAEWMVTSYPETGLSWVLNTDPETNQEYPWTVDSSSHTYDFDNPTYVWADNYSSCIVEFPCKEAGCESILQFYCNVTSETDNEAGKITYTAICTVNGLTYACIKTVKIKDTDHTSSSYEEIPETYPIIVDETKNGAVEASDIEACEGDEVTITITPDRYYALASLVVTNSKGRELDVTDNGDGTYTFIMPASKVTIEASFELNEDYLLFLDILGGAAAAYHACPSEPYTDVDTSLWYHEAIDYVIENGLMIGTSAASFEPNAVTNRAMLVTILYRLEGEPSVTGVSNFADVVDGAWYADAVSWASQNGIVNGYDNGCFGPSDIITREQMAAILYRYAQYKGYDVSVGENTNILSYTDALEISEWAMEAMQWAVGTGLITGVTESTLAPQSDSTRAVMATILMRFCENVAK